MGYERAEALLAVEHDNAEMDAVEGREPEWQLFHSDKDYRLRYVNSLLLAYRRQMVEAQLGRDGLEVVQEFQEF